MTRTINQSAMLAALCVAELSLNTAATRSAQAGFVYDPAASTAAINFSVVGTPAASFFSAGIGPWWMNPNFIGLQGVFEPTIGTHVGAPVTPNWVAYGTAVTHTVGGVVNAAGILNALVAINIPQTSHLLTADPGNLIGLAELRTDFNVELVATPGGFNVGALPGFYALTYNVPAGSFGDFYAEINYAAVNALGVVVPIGQQVFTPAGPLAGAGVAAMAAPGGLNVGTVAFNMNPLLNGRLRVSGFIRWRADNEAGPVSMELTQEDPLETCPADLNYDGTVNRDDMMVLIENLGPCPGGSDCPADINGDGIVDWAHDGRIILRSYGDCSNR